MLTVCSGNKNKHLENDISVSTSENPLLKGLRIKNNTPACLLGLLTPVGKVSSHPCEHGQHTTSTVLPGRAQSSTAEAGPSEAEGLS